MKKLFLSFSILFLLLVGPLAHAQKLTFIVNKNNPVTSISRQQLIDFYFKRSRTWPNQVPVRFFDRAEGSSIRNSFLKFIGRTSRQVEQFWIGQKLYSGDSAPTQIESDSMVVSLVSRFPGGFGYVSNDKNLAEEVKVIDVEGY